MNRCATCKYWKPVKQIPNNRNFVLFNKGGYCTSDAISEGYSDDCYLPNALVYPYCEGGSFWTGPDFGCVHHEPVNAVSTEG